VLANLTLGGAPIAMIVGDFTHAEFGDYIPSRRLRARSAIAARPVALPKAVSQVPPSANSAAHLGETAVVEPKTIFGQQLQDRVLLLERLRHDLLRLAVARWAL
jgi:hypothetical protein